MYQNAFQAAPALVFKPEDLPCLLFGENFQLYGDEPIQYDSDTETFFIHLSLKEDPGICPHCLQKSCRFHDYQFREIQVFPLQGKTTFAIIHEKRWECHHPECSAKTFTTPIPEAEDYAHRSQLLNLLIFSIALFCSASAAALVCKGLGIRVSDDSILRLYKRIEIMDDPDVEFVGVDDVAIRKGQVYSTLVYDGKTHHILAMLDGRDGKALKEWLKGHKKIKVITRDRAGAYASAISEVLPDCIQIADKFHLFQNLLGYLKDIFTAELPPLFFVKDGKEVIGNVEKTYEYLDPLNPQQAAELNYDNTPPVDENGVEIRFDNKSRDLSDKNYVRHAENRIKKYERAVQIRSDWFHPEKERPKKKELQEKYGTSAATINKILKMTDDEVEKIKEITVYKKKHTPMDDYYNIVYKMLSDGHKPSVIFRYIRAVGYKGSLHSLRNHIHRIAVNNFQMNIAITGFYQRVWPKDMVVIKRSEVLKYMTIRNKEQMADSDAAKYYEVLKANHPVLAKCEEIWNGFSEVMGGNDPDLLDQFIQKNDEGLIQPFINGLKRDIAPVKNAISYSETSGFVEGGNCRWKHTKRTMFGRCGSDLLFRKAFAISSIFHLGKTVKETGNF